MHEFLITRMFNLYICIAMFVIERCVFIAVSYFLRNSLFARHPKVVLILGILYRNGILHTMFRSLSLASAIVQIWNTGITAHSEQEIKFKV